MDLTGLIAFIERFVVSVSSFTTGLFNFMTYEIAVFNNVTIFELMFGAGITVYLTTTITKWLIGVIA